MIESKSATVPAGPLDGERFDVAASALFPEISRKKIKSIIDAGGAYCNKRRIQVAKHLVKIGDKLEIFWDVKSDLELMKATEGQRVKFIRTPHGAVLKETDVLFEHADFVVVNKPAGLPSQATLVSSTDTILHALQALDPKRFALESLFLVHRLDKDTSGVLLIGRNARAKAFLEEAFRDRKVTKTYEALCFNVPPEASGVISYPLAKVQGQANTYYPVMKKVGKTSSGSPKSAETRFEVKQAFAKAQASHILCFPTTGRTHQIRVHLMAVGCPLLGDKTYARNILGHPLGQVALRHMLHARAVAFAGPNGEKYVFEAPVPADFAACLETLTARG